MLIANPIYDVVFRYLMDDLESATEILSAVTGEEIVELQFNSTEHPIAVPGVQGNDLTVCRFDFSAKIKVPSGYKTVMFELQKAKLASDIMRFRRYLGFHYSSQNNSEPDDETKARQIYCIFFLGYGIGYPGHPILQATPNLSDATTQETLPTTSEFVTGLHHKSWIVQIPELKGKQRNDLEKLLSIFDQSRKTLDDRHVLKFDENILPEKYRHILRILHKASGNQEVRERMEAEDDYLWELQIQQRQMAKLEAEFTQALEEVVKTKDAELSAKDAELLAEKQKTTQQVQALSAKEAELAAQAAEIAELKKLLKQKK
jgi:hypothetical protein